MSNGIIPAEELVADWPHKSAKVILVPYSEAAAGEECLPRLYYRLRAQHLVDRVFPGVQNFGLNWFVNFMATQPVLLVIARATGDIVGFGWVYGMEGKEPARKAIAGFAFFKEWWGHPEILDATHLGLRFWFTQYKLAILFGTILKSNALARRFAEKIGFQEIAELPMFFTRDGSFADAVMVALTRDAFDRSDSHGWTL